VILKSGIFQVLIAMVMGLAGRAAAEGLSGKNARANKLFEKGQHEEALKTYRDAQIEDPESPALHYNIGTTLYRKKAYQEAVQELEKALTSKDPLLQQRAYYNIGNCQYRAGEELVAQGKQEGVETMRQAIEAYKKALELKSDDMDAKFNVEFVQNRLKELAQNSPQNQQQQQNKQDQQKQDQQKQDQKKQQQQPSQEQMSQEDAQRLLDAVKDEEKDLQKKLRKVEGSGRGAVRDW
jgi:tetratricopeptide (TPR) repeat protein